MAVFPTPRMLALLSAGWPFRLRPSLWGVLIVALIVGCLASALAVVTFTHMTRNQFAQLQELERERSQLDTEWGQLLLEEGAWSSPARIEQVATERLNMRLPDVDDVEVIRP